MPSCPVLRPRRCAAGRFVAPNLCVSHLQPTTVYFPSFFIRSSLFGLAIPAFSSGFLHAVDGRPSVRSAISFAARTLPRAALRTITAAIICAYVRPALSPGYGVANRSSKAAVNLLRRGLPAGFPLVPFGHGFRFRRLAISPFFHCFLTVTSGLQANTPGSWFLPFRQRM